MSVEAPVRPQPVESERIPGWVLDVLHTWRAILLVVLTAAMVGAAVAVYYLVYRPDQQNDAAVSAAAKKAAEDGTVAVLSYEPENLTSDIAKAKSYLTGEFLDYYTRFTDSILAAAAQQREVATAAHISRSATADLHADSAVVLLFVDKESTSRSNPAPRMTPTTVRATMKKVNGNWLIEKFEPL
ncbi:MAG: Mce-associated rane protein [Mycobacterium sp.]|nr:Mce-associated rane protein [Mycobacterium sp.]